jgi:hypothetical protein
MRVYRVIVQADKYPMEWSVQASNFATAAARGIREWHNRFKGTRATEVKIKIIKGGELLKENEK